MISDIIKNRKMNNSAEQLKIMKIADFAEKHKITRQFIYDYIRREKIKTLNLPIYVSYQGKMFQIGVEKFIDLENSEYKGREMNLQR